MSVSYCCRPSRKQGVRLTLPAPRALRRLCHRRGAVLMARRSDGDRGLRRRRFHRASAGCRMSTSNCSAYARCRRKTATAPARRRRHGVELRSRQWPSASPAWSRGTTVSFSVAPVAWTAGSDRACRAGPRSWLIEHPLLSASAAAAARPWPAASAPASSPLSDFRASAIGSILGGSGFFSIGFGSSLGLLSATGSAMGLFLTGFLTGLWRLLGRERGDVPPLE